MNARTTYLSACLVALTALACGDAPRPAGPAPLQGKPSTQAGALPDGHPPLGELPAGHPQLSDAPAQRPALTDPSQFAGTALLKGELARATSGRLMVSLRQKGQSGPKMPLWAYVVDVGDPDAQKKGLGAAGGDTREFVFVLNKDTTILPSPLPANVELEVELRYDLDGSVDTREDAVFAVTDAVRGDSGLVLVLEKPQQQ